MAIPRETPLVLVILVAVAWTFLYQLDFYKVDPLVRETEDLLTKSYEEK